TSLVVLGGGPIGTELAQTFNRLGSEVTQVEADSHILVREDREVAEMVMETMIKEGVNILAGHKATKAFEREGEKFLVVEDQGGKEKQVAFDELLVAVGRKASVEGYGLEELDIRLTDRGTVEVNDYLQTNYPNIYAIGDVAGPYQFTHTASHMAWFATINALFGTFWKFPVDYSVIPWCTFTSPEVARVGLNEQEAVEQGIDFEITTYDVGELDRAVADEEKTGIVKVLTAPGKDRILGVTIVADHAGDLLAEYVLAMKHGIGLNKILSTIHIYPTLAEMNKFAASEWRKAHKPEKLLDVVEKYHAWRRGQVYILSVAGAGGVPEP
ncbi:MAG: FAD-dependent oxidoreductase, partial [Pseudomonadales bacterium]|nr:FAD-dependent oxidoreductase [Pseudomonadales bacterium]